MALSEVLAQILDEGNAMASRGEARVRVLALFDEPLDPGEAAEYKRDRWGADQQAAQASEQTEKAFAGQAGDFADVDLDTLRAGTG